MRAIHLEPTFRLYEKCREVVYSCFQCSKFSTKYQAFFITLKLIYHRFYTSYLFLPGALDKTTTDQNNDTTWCTPIYSMLEFAVQADQSRRKFHKIRTFFCMRKQAVNYVSTPKSYMLYIVKLYCHIHIDAIPKV